MSKKNQSNQGVAPVPTAVATPDSTTASAAVQQGEAANPETAVADAAADASTTTVAALEGSTREENVTTVRVRVLAFCAFGKPDDIIEMDAEQAATMKDVVDADPAAVAYAESIAKV